MDVVEISVRALAYRVIARRPKAESEAKRSLPEGDEAIYSEIASCFASLAASAFAPSGFARNDDVNMDKVIFLDRDGVINRDPAWMGKDYVTKWGEFQFLPGALEAIRLLTKSGYKIAIISNQAGVGKGIYTREALDEITKKMLREIENCGGRIFSVQYCIHAPGDNCDCRKPKIGLFKKAVKGLDVDFTKSYFIGDAKRDIEAGGKIGCRTILVLSGKVRDRREVEGWEFRPDRVVEDLIKAVKIIIKTE